eukprot:7169814-Pyramimonas_sp.AAC.1
MLLVHAFGPTGHAYKWTNLYTYSTWVMQKQGRDRAKNSKSYPGYGADELNPVPEQVRAHDGRHARASGNYGPRRHRDVGVLA